MEQDPTRPESDAAAIGARGPVAAARRLPPLALQLIVPMALVFAGTFTAVSVATVQAAAESVERSYRRELALAASVLARPGFPLTQQTLDDVAEVWGVSLAVARADGEVRATTLSPAQAAELAVWWAARARNYAGARGRDRRDDETHGAGAPGVAIGVAFGGPGTDENGHENIAGRGRAEYATAAFDGDAWRVHWRARVGVSGETERVFVLVPASRIETDQLAAATPAAAGGLIGLLATGLLSLWIARTIVQPVRRLAGAAAQVATSAKQPHTEPAIVSLPVGRGSREVAELANALREMLTALVRSREALVAAERLATLGHAGARLAHELRGPLAGIRLNLDSLRPALGAGEARETLDDATGELDRLAGIATEWLDAFREPLREPEWLDLGDIARQACRLAAPQLDHLGVTLVCESGAVKAATGKAGADASAVQPAEAVGPAYAVRGAAGPLTQLVTNLVSNAAEACSTLAPGRSRRVVVSVRCAGGPRETDHPLPDDNGADVGTRPVELEVSDNGPGIPADVRARLFEPFVTGRGERGTGLGLAIVQSIANRHGATISVDTGPDGTSFRLIFPAADAAI